MLLLGSAFSADISMSDQPSMPPMTATFETLGRYLQQYDRAEVFYLSPD